MAVGLHLTAVWLMAALLLLPYRDGVSVLFAGWTDPAVRAQSWGNLFLHVCLAATVWGLVFVSYRWLRTLSRSQVHRIAKSRGQAMIETLIALPLILLLIFGLSQMTLNNVAGMFSNVAAFQAARAAWIWYGEPCESCDVRERAEEMGRIQGAAVLVPVASNQVGADDPSLEFFRMRGLLVGSQLARVGEDLGAAGMDVAGRAGRDDTVSLAAAMGHRPFIHRTAVQFTSAYGSTNVSVSENGDFLRVSFLYRHHNSMPLVAAIFGSHDTVGGTDGFFTRIERTVELRRLPQANRRAVIHSNLPPLLL